MQIGILGTGSIAKSAIIRPSQQLPSARVTAIASRDGEKAKLFAKKYGIEKHYSPYEVLLRDPSIDLIYITLPNSLHAEWSIRALEAGKHVLCEKPLASNAQEVEEIRKVAQRAKKLVFEGMHYKYHPLIARIKEIVNQGDIGTIEHISADLCLYLYRKNNIRFSYNLAGGALIDGGCYPLHLIRHVMNAEPTVISASAHLLFDEIDDQMSAKLLFPNGAQGSLSCSLRSPLWKWRMQLNIIGTKGRLFCLNPFAPQFLNALFITNKKGKKIERFDRKKTTYDYQLQFILNAIKANAPLDLQDPLDNMRAIDAIYTAAGMKPRGLPCKSSI